MLDVEAALARAKRKPASSPGTAVAPIAGAARVEHRRPGFTPGRSEMRGNLAIPLVKQLTARVKQIDRRGCGRYVHWGATSQDIIDTALVLQLREASG